MPPFVAENSIVRRIWSRSETVLFIFAGAAAEFALNKAVDWLYFTGRLPADPLGRLFSTVQYARRIVFASEEKALAAIDQITKIHQAVETARGSVIPDWAYRDVLYLLIHYSIASYEMIERPLTAGEKDELYSVFLRIGQRMGLSGLPESFDAWLPSREEHLRRDLAHSAWTDDLYRQYRKHLGAFRYFLVRQLQAVLVPPAVREMLALKPSLLIRASLPLYKAGYKIGLDRPIKAILLPEKYKAQVAALDVPSAG
ncbi:oxygenase MpaB family protein [Flaviaesturariibacter terrae]